MITKITVGRYAKLIGKTRDAIYKRMLKNIQNDCPLHTNLEHVKKIEIIGGIQFLHVDCEKLVSNNQ